MAGHFGRPGAVRKGAKKGSKVGSGGQRRAALEGKGPTPKAEDRTYHPAYKRKQAAEKALKSAPKLRKELQLNENYELVVGRNPVTEAVASQIPYRRVFLVGALANDDRVAEIIRNATRNGVPLVEVTRSELDRMSAGANHQGVAIEVPPHVYVELPKLITAGKESGRPGLIVALDSVTDPHNLGAVIRSAAAFKADGVLIPERRSASINVTAWKVSAGAVARLLIAREKNLVRALEELQEAGYFVVGLAGDADVPVSQIPCADMPLVLVTGSEGKGLSRLVRETCDLIAAIPISASTESLNAAVATGISLYQIDQLRMAE